MLIFTIIVVYAVVGIPATMLLHRWDAVLWDAGVATLVWVLWLPVLIGALIVKWWHWWR